MSAPAPARPAESPAVRVPGRRRRGVRPGVLTGALVLVCLTLMLLDIRGGPTDVLRVAGSWLGGPLEALSSSVFGPVRQAPFRRPDTAAMDARIVDLTQQNLELQRRLDALAEQAAAQPDAAAVRRYAADLPGALTARVVAAAAHPGSEAVVIDAGSADGVRRDSPVLVPAGLVGTVQEVGPTTSTVRLLTDPASAVAVRLQSSRQAGMARGTGEQHTLALTFVDPLAAVSAGERAVTMGSPDDWPFPPGIPVGTVAAVSGGVGDLGRRISLAPAFDAGTLDHVAVVIAHGDAAGVVR